MNAFIYCRQSSGDDDFSESVEVQRKNCLKLAAEKSINVIETFKDLNSSGKLYPSGYDDLAIKDLIYQNWIANASSYKTNRPGLGALFARLSEVQYIIVDDYTRLARPLNGSFLNDFISQIIFSCKVKILTVKTGEIDLNSFNDSLIIALQNRINDNQIAIQRKKSMDGLRKLRDNGTFMNGMTRAFGYKRTDKYKVGIDPVKAPVVKFIYEKVLQGMPYSKIVGILNSKYITAFVKGKASRQIINKVIERPWYCGYMYDSNKMLIKAKQITDDLILVSYTDWLKAQEIIGARKVENPRPKKRWFPYSGKVFCGVCGDRMVSKTSPRAFSYYRCDSHASFEKEPCKVTIRAAGDRDEGCGLLEGLAPLFILSLTKKLEALKSNEKIRKEIEANKVALTNLSTKEKNLTKMFVDGLIDEENLRSSLQTMAEEKKNLNQSILLLEKQTDPTETEEKNISLIRKVVNNNISQGEYNELMRDTIKRINVWQDHIIVETFWGSVNIPRKHIGHFRMLPHFSFRNNGNNSYYLYYYFSKNPIVNVYSKQKTIFKANGLEIILVE